jgi:hypothetical protein
MSAVKDFRESLSSPLPPDRPMIPVSLGELLDKISILRIKLRRLSDEQKKLYVLSELDCLQAVLGDTKYCDTYLKEFEYLNSIIWDAVDDYDKNYGKCGGYDHAEQAAQVAHETNLKRFALKDKVNREFNSVIREQKGFA